MKISDIASLIEKKTKAYKLKFEGEKVEAAYARMAELQKKLLLPQMKRKEAEQAEAVIFSQLEKEFGFNKKTFAQFNSELRKAQEKDPNMEIRDYFDNGREFAPGRGKKIKVNKGK